MDVVKTSIRLIFISILVILNIIYLSWTGNICQSLINVVAVKRKLIHLKNTAHIMIEIFPNFGKIPLEIGISKT